MNNKTILFKYGIRATLVVLTALLCYASIASTTAQSSAQSSAQRSGQDSITGQWIIEMKPGTDSAYVSINRRSEHGHHSSSTDFRRDMLRGLTDAQASGSGTAVSFQIVREAGTLNCEGWFKNGQGSGTFTFAPNPGFAAEMRSLGYDRKIGRASCRERV